MVQILISQYTVNEESCEDKTFPQKVTFPAERPHLVLHDLKSPNLWTRKSPKLAYFNLLLRVFFTEIHILCIFGRTIGIRSFFTNEALEMSYERSCNMRVFEARGPSRL